MVSVTRGRPGCSVRYGPSLLPAAAGAAVLVGYAALTTGLASVLSLHRDIT